MTLTTIVREWVLPRFAVHPRTGELEGVGITRFPDVVARPRERTRLF